MKYSLQRFFLWNYFILIALFLTIHSFARANDEVSDAPAVLNYAGPKFQRLGGQYLSICSPDSGICKRVKMPKTLGRVEQIYPGPFIERADASWLSMSEFESFLCAVPADTRKVVCVRVSAERFPIEHAHLRVGIHRDGRAGTFAEPKTPAVDEIKLAAISVRYNKAVERAAEFLQGESDGVGMRSFSFGATTNVCDDKDPGPPPHPDCILVNNMWQCEIIGHPDPGGDVPWPVPFPDFPGTEPPPLDPGGVPLCHW